MTYEEAMERYEFLSAPDQHVSADCRSLLLTHGYRTRRVTVFLHGLTASPRQFEALATEAYRLGDNVFVPRLPRHGHRDRLTETLRNLRSGELFACAEESVAIAGGLGQSVRVVGFSLGGLLAAWIAQHHSIESAIAIAPFLGIAWIPKRLTPAVARAVRAMPNAFMWWDQVRRTSCRHMDIRATRRMQ